MGRCYPILRQRLVHVLENFAMFRVTERVVLGEQEVHKPFQSEV
jgi:hypothetical protein